MLALVAGLEVVLMAAAREPLVVIDFGEAQPAWSAVDDVVMGGISRSGLAVTDDATGVFAGEVSLENNGGFASVRARVGPLDLTAYDHLELRVRGDGQRYRLRLRTDPGLDGVAYQAAFAPTAGAWQTVRLPLAAFEPTFRGRSLTGQAAPLDRSRIHQIGLMIADRQAGPFRLEIATILAKKKE